MTGLKSRVGQLARSLKRRTGGSLRAPPGAKPPPKIEDDTRKPLAALTFVWNEEAYLKRWVEYYGRELGRENLFVYAHGADPMVARVAEGCTILPLPRGRVDARFARRKSDLAAGMISFLLAEYQTVIVGDVDEMVIVDPEVAGSLTEYVSAHRHLGRSLKPFNLDLLHDREAGHLDPARPILAQRKLARTRYQFCKPVIVSDKIEFAAGFHYANHHPVIAPGAYLVHLHFADRRINKAIANLRKASVEANPHLSDGHSRSKGFWSQHMERFKQRQKSSAKMPIVELDTAVREFHDAMEASVTFEPRTKINKPGWTMTFGSVSNEVRIRIPDRFAQVL